MSERTLTFGANNGLVGTLALPERASAPSNGIGFLLFNAGIVHRVGPHRINVRLARQLAARGIASLRFDLAGHGDSARLAGDQSFEAQAVIDIRSAMDALGEAAGLKEFAIFGYCSGAYYGFAAALVDPRIAAILMYDAYRYPTSKTRAIHYWKRLRQPGALRAILAAAGRVLASRGRAGETEAPPVPELGRIDFIPTKEEFAAGLRTLLARGVKLHMIYSGGGSNDYNYAGQFADAFAAFGLDQRIRADFLPELDHVASGLGDQAELMRRVLAWGDELGRAAPASGGATA